MKKFIATICLLSILAFPACSAVEKETITEDLNETNSLTLETKETEKIEKEKVYGKEDVGEIFLYVDEVENQINTSDYPNVADKITWDDINAFPIANETMTTDELRALCVDFFRFAKSFAWTPSENYDFQKNEKGGKDKLEVGTIYGGLPYVGLGSGSIYRTMDYYDSETGILDISKIGHNRYLFGNQCSIGAYWGWGRVINSADYLWTWGCVEKNGFIRVGPYTYSERDRFTTFLTTSHVVKNNGEQTMFESYALLKPADGLVYYTSAGHVIMCSSEAVVKRNPDGTINGDESFIYKIDQAQNWKDYPQSNGDARQVKAGIDTKYSFKKLYEKNYVPFTFAEFLGTDPVEKSECTINLEKNSVTLKELKAATITANYGISDVYIIARGMDGTEIFRYPIRTTTAGNKEMSLSDITLDYYWNEYAKSKNSITIEVQLSTGERPIIYTGTMKP